MTDEAVNNNNMITSRRASSNRKAVKLSRVS